ncbi:hypothetical protein I5Q34_08315 [Streptomyces sp. AV19]|uniref:hypothetical protein n=1 Tax=Streptomyces sp. AV19 TaxID=2793068 RepID=UPI0018FE5E0E|nr:hypothetical protein [Streptomyces sp. AV19]MBH1934297.1 hypothetical protein [Streptomyces sp. AV19]MDG4533394.1 hypothetical protein [Streptomyces sp. AV19]
MQEQGPDRTDYGARRSADLLRLARTALSGATAVLARSAAGGEKGMAAVDRALGELWETAEDLASTGPAAGVAPEADVRTVITGMYVGEDVGRMAVLARQVGDIAWARRSKPPLPASVGDPLRDMGEACLGLIDRAHDSVASPARGAVTDAQLADVEDRQERLCHTLLSGSAALGVMDAVDVAVLGRCYAECAQRAAAVAAHVALLRRTAPRG